MNELANFIEQIKELYFDAETVEEETVVETTVEKVE